ncbi:MAG: hypothetical protein AB7P21_25725 [Lautropia sp.]
MPAAFAPDAFAADAGAPAAPASAGRFAARLAGARARVGVAPSFDFSSIDEPDPAFSNDTIAILLCASCTARRDVHGAHRRRPGAARRDECRPQCMQEVHPTHLRPVPSNLVEFGASESARRA